MDGDPVEVEPSRVPVPPDPLTTYLPRGPAVPVGQAPLVTSPAAWTRHYDAAARTVPTVISRC